MKFNITLLRVIIITLFFIIINTVLLVTAAGYLTYVGINLLVISLPAAYYSVDWNEYKQISNESK